MPDLLSDGNVAVYWVPGGAGILDYTTPKATEIIAGTKLDTFMTPTGLAPSVSTAQVDLSSLASTVSAQGTGRRTASYVLTLKRQTGTDANLAILTYKAIGFLLVRRNLPSATAPAAAQIWDCYPAQLGEPDFMSPAPNTVQTYTVPVMVTGDYKTNAVAAA